MQFDPAIHFSNNLPMDHSNKVLESEMKQKKTGKPNEQETAVVITEEEEEGNDSAKNDVEIILKVDPYVSKIH